MEHKARALLSGGGERSGCIVAHGLIKCILDVLDLNLAEAWEVP